jgi:hypothetical protein
VSERIRRVSPATALMAGASTLSAVLLIHWQSRFTWWRDEWGFVLHRQGWSPGTFFHPFVEQLLAIPVLIYKVSLEIFGMGSALPVQLVAIALFILSVVMLFLYGRRRMGEWLALASVLPILFLGPSWDDLLFAFQLALFGSVACGIGAFLALDREDRTGDLVAMALLILALLFFDLGIPFVAGATVLIAFSPDRWRRSYVVLVPTALWLLWYAGWGHAAETFISFHNFTQTPQYMLDGLASSIATLLGLGSIHFNAPRSPTDWGRPLLVLAVAAAAWRLFQLRRISPQLAAVTVTLLGFWFLSGINTNPLSGGPTVGRYQYLGIVLLVLVAAELLRGVALTRLTTGIVVFIGAAAAVTNAPELRDAAGSITGLAQQERGGLAALELSRDRVNPGLVLTEQNSDVNYLLAVDAGSYLGAVDAHGSPAYTPAELETASEPARVAADKVFGAALRLGLQPATGAPAACSASRSVANPVIMPVPTTGLVLSAAGPGVQVSLRRYASDSFPVALGPLPGGQAQLLRIPTDRSQRPWTLQLSGAGAVTVCRTAS